MTKYFAIFSMLCCMFTLPSCKMAFGERQEKEIPKESVAEKQQLPVKKRPIFGLKAKKRMQKSIVIIREVNLKDRIELLKEKVADVKWTVNNEEQQIESMNSYVEENPNQEIMLFEEESRQSAGSLKDSSRGLFLLSKDLSNAEYIQNNRPEFLHPDFPFEKYSESEIAREDFQQQIQQTVEYLNKFIEYMPTMVDYTKGLEEEDAEEVKEYYQSLLNTGLPETQNTLKSTNSDIRDEEQQFLDKLQMDEGDVEEEVDYDEYDEKKFKKEQAEEDQFGFEY